MQFYIAGNWLDRAATFEVRNPYSGEVIDTVPKGTQEDVNSAIDGAIRGAKIMAALPGYDRFLILRRVADLMRERTPELARTLSMEEGKTLREATVEVERSVQTIELSGEEAKRLGGEYLPLDGGQGTQGKMGFTMRVPCGVVAAITPFNFPLNLVCHKVGPALAAGNAVILKPASDTPLSALNLVKLLLEAGLPPLGISCITGGGGEIGDAICTDRRVRKISFTGSQEIGERICRTAGLKRVTMELGSNSPIVVLPDADLDKVAQATLATGFANAGQVCISAQRMIVLDKVHDELIAKLKPKVESLVAGDPMCDATQMGPMIREADAVRVQSWIQEAVAHGAQLVCGGDRHRTVMQPTLLTDTTMEMKVVRDELFGPAVSIQRAGDIAEAIRLANDSRFGLSAGIFTQDIDAAMRFAREVHSGNIHINWGPMWRTDLMPYGGLKDSGFGKEGPKYAINEMTEMKTVIIHTSK